VPNVPCSAEVGVPIELGYMRAFTCLKGTPQAAIDEFEAAVQKASAEPRWHEWLVANGMSDEYAFDSKELRKVFDTFYEVAKDLFENSKTK
jgi:tripartite-type tricarboxylate transporter receptor subunit TctC